MILPIILGALALGSMVLSWLASLRYTRHLDRRGRDYNMERWMNESNRSYALRIRNRSVIRGFPRW